MKNGHSNRICYVCYPSKLFFYFPNSSSYDKHNWIEWLRLTKCIVFHRIENPKVKPINKYDLKTNLFRYVCFLFELNADDVFFCQFLSENDKIFDSSFFWFAEINAFIRKCDQNEFTLYSFRLKCHASILCSLEPSQFVLYIHQYLYVECLRVCVNTITPG